MTVQETQEITMSSAGVALNNTPVEKMNGILFYYSGSGNTKLACQYIVQNLSNVKFKMVNIVKTKNIFDLAAYDIVGFATFTDFGDPPFLIHQFMDNIPEQGAKLAFVFNTFGFMSGRTLKSLAKLATARGFNVVAGFSLHTPESYPPMILRGRGAENEPNEKKFQKFNGFISELDEIVHSFLEGKAIHKKKLRMGFLNTLISTFISFSRTKAREDMGDKYVDEALCTECGRCAKGCPYGAITLAPTPQFDIVKCHGCWYCFNHCPEKAIYTEKYRGVGHYPKPRSQLKEKLTI